MDLQSTIEYAVGAVREPVLPSGPHPLSLPRARGRETLGAQDSVPGTFVKGSSDGCGGAFFKSVMEGLKSCIACKNAYTELNALQLR
jgi:hypothetical protein